MNRFRLFTLFPLVAFSALLCHPVAAQKPTIGIKLGVAVANAKLISSYDGQQQQASSRTSILGGVYLNVNLGPHLLLRPGAEFVSKGAREKNEYDPFGYPIALEYLDIPVSILYKTNHLVFGGGPFAGLPLKGRYETFEQPIEYGINAQVGYELPIGASVNVNYSYGFSKIGNRYLGISLGYTF